MKCIRVVLTAAAALWFSAASAPAGDDSKVQSSARPQGLQPYDNVQVSGSDSRAAEFNTTVLPTFLEIIDASLKETVVFQQRSGFKLDATRLFMRTASDQPLRIYFVAEGAAYHNTLGFAYTTAGSKTLGTKKLIFPDASQGTKRTAGEPLQVGDFVELDKGAEGLEIDFFLISNGASGGSVSLYNDPALNSDKLQHVVAFLLPKSRYILIGFEDIVGGGDLDYNDLLFVVDIGTENALCLDKESNCLPH